MKKLTFSLLLVLLTLALKVRSQDFKSTAEYPRFEGFFDFFYDEEKDRILLEIDRLEDEFLYVNALSKGLGSNDIGLDRGKINGEQVVYFKKAGPKLLLVQPNLNYRAYTDNALEQKSVEQAFALSVIHGFPIIEESEGHYLVDLTPFLLRDATGVARTLKQRKQGAYTLDKERSAISMDRTRAFPKNVEFEVLLTFKGTPSGSEIRSVSPNPYAVTLGQHHSFVELPGPGYEPRAFDPRSGSWPFAYYDYASPVQEPIQKRFITRHRLQKKDPSAPVSEAVEPLVYYLDNGVPEPIRSALLEGGRWWNEAFEAIGYKDAFQLKMLPEDADPLDIRYNVIQWVHRSTRGWSYGNTVTDPRTGEIIKGHVSLGSLRIRQDFLIAQALMERPYEEKNDNHQAMLEIALARIRQLSAHEIGHTLGFAHNFAGSSTGRTSVMDYPHPQVNIRDGKIDFSRAYNRGVGEWDKVSVAYAYGDLPEGVPEDKALRDILDRAWASGLRYLSDPDARPPGSAHPHAHLWDNGADAAEELSSVMGVRRLALRQFSAFNVPEGRAQSELEDVFVPLYFFHRYQTEAAAKLIGGIDYRYRIRGDGQPPSSAVDKETQEKALHIVLRTLSPEELAIPESLLPLFGPRTYGYPRSRESFPSKMGVAFDPLAISETAANFTLEFLLDPQRANRLMYQKSRDPEQLGLGELLRSLLEGTVHSSRQEGYAGRLQEVIDFRVLEHLFILGAHPEVYPGVRSEIFHQLKDLSARLGKRKKDPQALQMNLYIDHYLKNPRAYTPIQDTVRIPDGSPIGQACSFGFPIENTGVGH